MSKQKSSKPKWKQQGEKSYESGPAKQSGQGGFKSIWEMDDKEKELQEEHMQMLSEKYRDRAKERRQGQYDMRVGGEQYVNISDDEDEQDQDKMIKVKGLDYDLLREKNADLFDQKKQTEQNKLKLQEIRNSIITAKTKVKKEPGKFAKSVLQAVKDDKKYNIGLFPKPNSYYKYEISNFSHDIPETVFKQKHTDQEEKIIAQVSENCYDKIGRIMQILKAGGRQKLREEREKLRKQKQEEEEEQKKKEKEISDEDNIFSDLDMEEEQEQDKEKQKEPYKLKLLDDKEDVFGVKKQNSSTLQKESSSSKVENVEESKDNKQQQDPTQKRKRNVLEEVDYYDECFQSSVPTISQLKQLKVDKKKKPAAGKQKNEDYDRQYSVIEKMMEDRNKKA